VQLGFENKKQTTWAAVLGVVAVLAVAYEVLPMFSGSSVTASSVPPPAPVTQHASPPRIGTKPGKKPRKENLDPTLRLDLLASSEQTVYEGSGRNIFVSRAEEVVIQAPKAPGNTDGKNATGPSYTTPVIPQAPPIPLKFYGFASSVGEPKKIFLKMGEDVWVAGEGEIVDRRYKVIQITPTSVSIQDMVYSSPPQSIPLTSG
jgi:hypothetical protein